MDHPAGLVHQMTNGHPTAHLVAASITVSSVLSGYTVQEVIGCVAGLFAIALYATELWDRWRKK